MVNRYLPNISKLGNGSPVSLCDSPLFKARRWNCGTADHYTNLRVFLHWEVHTRTVRQSLVYRLPFSHVVITYHFHTLKRFPLPMAVFDSGAYLKFWFSVWCNTGSGGRNRGAIVTGWRDQLRSPLMTHPSTSLPCHCFPLHPSCEVFKSWAVWMAALIAWSFAVQVNLKLSPVLPLSAPTVARCFALPCSAVALMSSEIGSLIPLKLNLIFFCWVWLVERADVIHWATAWHLGQQGACSKEAGERTSPFSVGMVLDELKRGLAKGEGNLLGLKMIILVCWVFLTILLLD